MPATAARLKRKPSTGTTRAKREAARKAKEDASAALTAARIAAKQAVEAKAAAEVVDKEAAEAEEADAKAALAAEIAAATKQAADEVCQKRRPMCVKSLAVSVSIDELATELIRRVPEEILTDAIISAAMSADKRLRSGTRHDPYKSKLVFQGIVNRFPNPSPTLRSIVGLEDARDAMPELEVLPTKVVPEEPAPPSSPSLEVAPEEHKDDQVDEFADILDIPHFEDYAMTFRRYPYVMAFADQGRNERVLALGYASGRDSSDNLVIRNCTLLRPGETGKGTAFNDIGSIVGVLKKSTPKGVRQFIKVVPYRVGMKVRCWHHVRGGGDKVEWNRYIILTDKGLKLLKNRPDWEDYQAPN